MNGLPYYKAQRRDFLDDTVGMSLEMKGAYRLLLDLIVLRDGSLPDDGRYIAGHLGCSLRKWRTIRDELVIRGKITLSDGVISTFRADKEIETSRKFRQKQAENASKPRKNKGLQQPNPSPIESYIDTPSLREDSDTSLRSVSGPAAAAPEPEPPPPVDLAKVLFDTGLALLTEQGHSPKAARAFLGKCRKAAGSDGIVIDAIGRAVRERATDAASFIAAIVKRQSRSPPAAADWQQEMAERLCRNEDGHGYDSPRDEDQAVAYGGDSGMELLARRASGH